MKNHRQNYTHYFQRKQDEAQHQFAVAPRSWWRSALVGYPLAILFAILASLIPWSESLLHIQDYFVEPPFVVATFLVGWFWGIGPALLALVLEVLFLDYWIVPPLESIDFFRWPYIASFAPFIVIQLFILGLILVQKKYRQQLIESNAQLERANQIKELFLSRVSHELKTPLTTIQGQVQLALRRLTRQRPLPAEFSFLSTKLETVDAQAHRLQALIDDLLNLSSLRTGKVSLQVAPSDLRAICSGVVEDQSALTDHVITLKLPADQVICQIDEGRIFQVVTNLVVNALKYSSVHSDVLVEVIQKETQVLLMVHNDGPAILPEQQKRIFEPFYRTPQACTPTIQGWGLGLAISKEIIELHGGQIRVESAEGEGTTFIVELPS